MASCSNCKTFILWGGVRDDDRRYCNQKCYEEGTVKAVAKAVPKEMLDDHLTAVHQGDCPVCQGPGPVDVHVQHSVISFVVASRWSSTPRVSCRSCGRKHQLLGVAKSAVLGWWGFPWGLLMTPVQIGRNVGGMLAPPNPEKPSKELQKIVRLMVASQVVNQVSREAVAPAGRAQ